MSIRVGIDLGTTFSAVARINEVSGKPEVIRNSFNSPITPSVLCFEENGNVSELDITIKAVDLTKYLSEFMLSLKPLIETNMGEEAFTKATVDYFSDLSKKDLDYTETNIKVHMEKIDGQWKVINTDDVLVGIFGGLEEFVRAPHN